MISTNNQKISIIIPCYNEKKTINKIVKKVFEQNLEKFEVIVVDDNSTDGSKEIIENLKNEYSELKIKTHDTNKGKGSAIISGLKIAQGEIILIQDADLEYDPDDYKVLISPFLKYDADVVFGSRFLSGTGPKRLHLFWHTVANKILTFLTNIFTNLNMSDMETGYKLFKRKYLDPENLEQKSFGIEPEITIKLAKKKIKFFEVPISYNGRGYNEGKKITIKDAFVALYCILRYSFFK